ncbi:hypothetical protein [Parvularcula dongshanensis]|uniref:Uncharacterized protein n=1 Tax=Parvularcula dongshanensis TaxID=1173995 RepID=A0A840I723_9PROT|nr:hypothetical protein [Parvularcula dongshanensis]MBB4660061.1 hypothetical protein [Parvularcula dongshanensis]
MTGGPDTLLILGAVVLGLFVLAVVLKTVIGLAFRYLLFVGVALFIYQGRYGTEVMAWMTRDLAVEIASIAGAAFVSTWVIGALFLRRTRKRVFLLAAIGILMTLLFAEGMRG